MFVLRPLSLSRPVNLISFQACTITGWGIAAANKLIFQTKLTTWKGQMWWTLNKVLSWLAGASSLQSSAADPYFSFPKHISGSESLGPQAHQHADEHAVVTIYLHTSVLWLHHSHHGACIHYAPPLQPRLHRCDSTDCILECFHAATEVPLEWGSVCLFSGLHVCDRPWATVPELFVLQVSKVINVSHQASHLSRISR